MITRKTINVITTSFYPEKNANANRINSLVKVLSVRYKVNVIYLLEAGKAYDIRATTSEFSENANVAFHPIMQSKYSGSNFFARIMHELWSSVKLNYYNLRIHSEVSIFSIPYLMLLPVSGVFSIFYNRRKVLEIRDIVWLYLEFAGSGISLTTKKIVDSIALNFVYKFDFIITVTQSQLDYLCAEGVPANHARVIPNGIDKVRFQHLSSLNINKNSSIVITYAGTIGLAQNLITLVEAARLLKNNFSYHFCIAGKGNDLPKVLNAIELNHLSNIEYLGELEWSDLMKLYSNSSILYAQLTNSPSLLAAKPTKIFEYASTGLPIIFGGFGEGERLVSKLENCRCIKPDDPEALVRTIGDINHGVISSYNKHLIKDNYIREDLLYDYISVIDC